MSGPTRRALVSAALLALLAKPALANQPTAGSRTLPGQAALPVVPGLPAVPALPVTPITPIIPIIRIAVADGAVSLPLYVAEAQGHFKAEGLDVRLQPCVSGRACVAALQAGQADVATASELVVALAPALPGAQALRIVATLSASTQHIKLVARRSAGIATAADLRGKRIASTAGTSAQYFLDCWLVFHGLDPAAMQLLSRPPGELAAALLNGEADAIAIWEPVASNAVYALADDALVLTSPRIYTQHFNLIAGAGPIAARRDELVRLLRAIDRAQRAIAADPRAARAVLLQRDASDANGLRVEDHMFRLSLEQSLVATMEAQVRWAAADGRPQAAAQADMLGRIDDTLLRAAVPSAVRLVQQRAR